MGNKSQHHFTESFIVAQLKKNNRDLKAEVQEKDRVIEQMKRNIKLTKQQEIEVELTVYIDECLRLRGQLEQVIMEKNMLIQQQDQAGGAFQRGGDDMANLEEAFRYQEMELQKEREQNQQLRMQVLKLNDQNNKVKERNSDNKKKLKGLTQLQTQNKRQAALLEQRQKEIQVVRMELGTLQIKLSERERVHLQNRDLVTKNCGQQSQIDHLKRQVQKLEETVNELQADRQKQGTLNRPGMGIGFRNT